MNDGIFGSLLKTTLISSLGIILILILRQNLFRKYTKRFNYYIWLIVIFRMLLLFEVPIDIPNNVMVHNIITNSSISTNEGNYSMTSIENNIDEEKSIDKSLLSELMKIMKMNYIIAFKYIWIITASIIVLYKIFLHFKYRNIILDLSHYIEESDLKNRRFIINKFDELTRDMKIKNVIKLKISEEVSVPMGIGILNRYIILPDKQYEEKEITWILKHELMHYKKNDIYYKILLMIITSIYWFNPLVYIMNRCINEDCELACDENVVEDCTFEEKQNYALTLINSLKYNQKYFLKCNFVTKLGNNKKIKRRFEEMFNKRGKKGMAVFIAALIIGICSVCTMVTKNNSKIIVGEEVQADDNKVELKELSTENYKGYYMVVSDAKRIKIGYSSNLGDGGETVSEIAQRYNALAAINGGPYSCESLFEEQEDNEGIRPSGIIMSNGQIIYSDIGSGETSLFGITEEGQMLVGSYSINDLKRLKVKEALSFYPALIIDGKTTAIKGDGGWGTAPRTAIGQRKDGSIILLVIDGKGVSIKELQDILYNLGAVNAINLDGGKSSEMYYGGKIINNIEKEKYIPTAIIVK